MNDLTVTQKFMLASLNKKEGLLVNTGKPVCLVAAGLIELQQEGCIRIEKKRVKICGELPEKRQYLKPLYDYIAAKEETKLSRVAGAFCLSLTGRRYTEYYEALGASLEQSGAVKSHEKGRILKKTGFAENQQAVSRLTEEIRKELLMDKKMDGDTAAVAFLLEKSRILKDYFSADERKVMKDNLQEKFKSPEGQMVKYMTGFVGSWYAGAAAAAIMAVVVTG